MAVLALAVPAVAQATGSAAARSPAEARRAVVSVTVSDEALHEVMMMREGHVDEQALRRVRIHQPYVLLMSGVAISARELVTPALHPRADLRIVVTMSDGTETRAELVGTDPRSNLALVELPAKDAMPVWLALDEVPVDRFEPVDFVGQHLEQAVCLRATVENEHLFLPLHDLYGVNGSRPMLLGSLFIAVGSAVGLNPGSACVRPDGGLAGIVVGTAGPMLITDAEKGAQRATMVEREIVLPARRIAYIVGQLRKNHRVIRAHYGIDLRPVTDTLRAQFDVPPSACAVVSIQDDSPAQAAGIRIHDVLLSVDGRNYRDYVALGDAMSDKTPHEPVKFKVLRHGQPIELTVTPDESPDVR